MERSKTPKTDRPLDYSLLYFASTLPDQADLRASLEEITRQTDAIQELTKAIEEIDSAYVPTFFSA